MSYDFDDSHDALLPVHPALDFVDGVAYVTVVGRTRDSKVQQFVVTSDEDGLRLFDSAEWPLEANRRGAVPRATVDVLDIAPRWTTRGLMDVQQGTLEAPTWQEAYEATYNALDAVLVLSDPHALHVLALYAMMSYFHPLFGTLPILHLLGPSSSGKSRAAVALSHIAFNGTADASFTRSSLFRNAHKGRYTQVLTETDNLSDKGPDDELVKDLQGACMQDEAFVTVSEKGIGGKLTPTRFYGFNPRVLASTQDFKRALTLRNRCIRLDFMKTANADQGKLRQILGSKEGELWRPVRDMLYRLLLCRWPDVAASRDHIRATWTGDNAPKERVFDKWCALAAMAHLVSPDVFKVVTEEAMRDMAEQRRDAANSKDGLLLSFAAWLVRNGDASLSREEMRSLLLQSTTTPGAQGLPRWAEEMYEEITVEKLSGMFTGPKALITELVRKRLLDSDTPVHTRTGNKFNLNRERILGIAGQYVNLDALTPKTGDEAEARAQPQEGQRTAHSYLKLLAPTGTDARFPYDDDTF